MIDKHLIDTNVLLVASAADKGSPFPEKLTPVDEHALRLKVLEWLIDFDKSQRQIILDWQWIIINEYKGENRSRETHLTDQDYGLQVVLNKYDKSEFFGVLLDVDDLNTAIIPHPTLNKVIHDAADRKMVAAVIQAGGNANSANLVNSCDSDWYDWKDELIEAGVEVEQLLHDWLHVKYLEKKQRGH